MDFSAEWVAWLQWPAMVASVLAAWLVASTHAGRRKVGFWVFLASNVLWVAWGLHDAAWALIALQVVLALMNVRGARKNERAQEREEA
ncbi:hypothetical protein [Ramlibacter sp. PS4R-6]|uniref:hypothetical protein n=1 Tax=Ramlibacter sp. PS4R-6 TaxID=3133438 RepID=UPI0030A00EE8